jgi:hypothetical protein
VRTRLSTRRSLLAASTLLLFVSSLALLAPTDASAARSASAYVVYKYYSDASHTTQVGECQINWHCIQGYGGCSGTQTAYYTAQIISQC